MFQDLGLSLEFRVRASGKGFRVSALSEVFSPNGHSLINCKPLFLQRAPRQRVHTIVATAGLLIQGLRKA